MDSHPGLTIICTSSNGLSTAQTLSQQLNLPITGSENYSSILSTSLGFDFALVVDDQGLQLQELRGNSLGALRVDFTNSSLEFRRRQNLQNELLAKAIGIRGVHNPLVWDVTAGMGQDSLLLASLGCEVTMFERNDIIHALLSDGLRRATDGACNDKGSYEASNHSTLSAALARITLHHVDAITALKQSDPPTPDIIYIDPMFPEKRKNTKARKAMQYCQQIVGQDEDSDELLRAALNGARYRVVVKRPKTAAFLDNHAPSGQLQGKTIRYDIYALRSSDNYFDEKNKMIR